MWLISNLSFWGCPPTLRNHKSKYLEKNGSVGYCFASWFRPRERQWKYFFFDPAVSVLFWVLYIVVVLPTLQDEKSQLDTEMYWLSISTLDLVDLTAIIVDSLGTPLESHLPMGDAVPSCVRIALVGFGNVGQARGERWMMCLRSYLMIKDGWSFWPVYHGKCKEHQETRKGHKISSSKKGVPLISNGWSDDQNFILKVGVWGYIILWNLYRSPEAAEAGCVHGGIGSAAVGQRWQSAVRREGGGDRRSAVKDWKDNTPVMWETMRNHGVMMWLHVVTFYCHWLPS